MRETDAGSASFSANIYIYYVNQLRIYVNQLHRYTLKSTLIYGKRLCKNSNYSIDMHMQNTSIFFSFWLRPMSTSEALGILHLCYSSFGRVFFFAWSGSFLPSFWLPTILFVFACVKKKWSSFPLI